MQPAIVMFDTHTFVKRLKAVGFTEEQSEVFAEEGTKLIEGQLATKLDIAELKRDMKGMETSLKRDMGEMETNLKLDIELVRRDMGEMETNLKRDMGEMETGLKLDIELVRRDMREMETGFKHDMKALEDRMVIKLGGLMVVAVGAMAALIRLFP